MIDSDLSSAAFAEGRRMTSSCARLEAEPSAVSAGGRPAQPAAFWRIVVVFTVVMLGTTLPSPLFSLYGQRLHVSPLMITVIYAIYAVGVVGALFGGEPLRQRLGRRGLFIVGVTLSAAAAIVFLATSSVALLIVARVLSGLAAGLVTGTATTALIDTGGDDHRARSATVAVAVNMGGLALGTLLAGGLAEVGTAPLRLPFAADLVLLFAAGTAFAGLPTGARSEAGAHGETTPAIRAETMRVVGDEADADPVRLRRLFIQGALSGGLGFAANGLFATMAAVFLADYLHLADHALAGAVIAVVFVATAAGQLGVGRISAALAAMIGCAGLVAGLGLLALSLLIESLPVFLAAGAVLGLSTGTCIGAALVALAAAVPARRRGSITSRYFVALYTFLAVPVLGAGALEHFVTVRTAGLLFCAVIGVTLVGVLATYRPVPSSVSEPHRGGAATGGGEERRPSRSVRHRGVPSAR